MEQSYIAWLAVLLLVGCGEPTAPDGSSDDTSEASVGSQFDAFKRLTNRLEEVVIFRKPRQDRLVVDELFDAVLSDSDMTELLVAHQVQIEHVIAAAHDIAPPVPPAPVLSEEESDPDSHLDAVASRLLNNSRLLLADAVRCWSTGDNEACGQRYEASLRIGLCLLDDDLSDHRFRGAQVLYPTIIELDLRVADGLGAQLLPQSRQGLRGLLQRVDTQRMLAWDDESETAVALRRLIRDLG